MNKVRNRKLVLYGSFAIALVLLTVVIAPDISATGPAAVIRIPEFTCTMFDLTGLGTFGADFGQIVVSDNKLSDDLKFSNAHLVCRAEIDNHTGELIVHDYDSTGEQCEAIKLNIDGTKVSFFTQDWRQTIQPSGESTLTCKFTRDLPPI